MEYVVLGRGGPMVSRIAFGCAAIGGGDYGPADDAESIRAVHAAIDAGITLFDVADVYGLGHAEEVLGAALRLRRDPRVVIATKVGVRWKPDGSTRRDSTPAWLAKAVEGSLTRLGVDHIHLYQLHWPDPNTPIEDTLCALQRLQEAGKIGQIGCSNFSLELIEQAQRHGRLDSQQLPFSLAERQHESTLRACAELGMLTMTYNSLANGLFTGKFAERPTSWTGRDLRARSPLFESPEFERNLARVERMREVGRRRGRTVAEVALRWVLDQPGISVALSGIRSPAQAIENAGATDWHLGADDLAFLEGTTETVA